MLLKRYNTIFIKTNRSSKAKNDENVTHEQYSSMTKERQILKKPLNFFDHRDT